MKSKVKKRTIDPAKKWDKSAWLAKSQHKDTSSAIFISPICDIKVTACDAGLHSIAWQMEEDISGKSKPRYCMYACMYVGICICMHVGMYVGICMHVCM